jgi:SagB-type dehydrogenase family enzyme
MTDDLSTVSTDIPPRLLATFHKHTTVSEFEKDTLLLERGGVRVRLSELPASIRSGFRRLSEGPEDLNDLGDAVFEAAGTDVLTRFWYMIYHVAKRGLIVWTVARESQPLITLVPTARSLAYPDQKPDHRAHYMLSRFAYLRNDNGHMTLESPRARCRMLLHESGVARLLHNLCSAKTVAELASCCPDYQTGDVHLLVGLLISAEMIVNVTEPQPTGENTPSLRTWEFHDLLFHTRSRNGRHDQPVGATYRFVGSIESATAVPLADSSLPSVMLYRPDIEKLKRGDHPFAYVQEGRRTLRTYADEPITTEELGEFLYRVARVRDRQTTDTETLNGPVRTEIASRPYPGAGALFELDLYPIVNSCKGLEPALYRYDPLEHRLLTVSNELKARGDLLQYASRSIGLPLEKLQVMIVIAARVPRVAWKYSSVAYSLVLKDTGVLLQTMYLAATAMGLAPCALGGGDADLFAEASGTDYFTTSSVGEFLLGAKNSGDEQAPNDTPA